MFQSLKINRKLLYAHYKVRKIWIPILRKSIYTPRKPPSTATTILLRNDDTSI